MLTGLPSLVLLYLFFYRVDSRIRQQSKHLAYHAELYETCLNGEPKATAYQCYNEHITPDGIVHGSNQFIHSQSFYLFLRVPYYYIVDRCPSPHTPPLLSGILLAVAQRVCVHLSSKRCDDKNDR